MAECSIEKKTENLLKKCIEDLGYELYDVEYIKEGKEYHLCIYIDKADGIDINDCEKVNDVISPILDDADYIKEQYFLEVSSTGLEKKLRKIDHFKKQIGNEIEINLFSKINDEKCVRGILKEINENFLILQTEKNEIQIDFEKISNAKSVYNW